MRWTVGKKLAISFSLVLLISLLVTIFSYKKLEELGRIEDDFVSNRLPAVDANYDLRIANNRGNAALTRFLLLRTSGSAAAAEAAKAEALEATARMDKDNATLRELSTRFISARNKVLVAEEDSAVGQYDRIQQEIMWAADADGLDKSVAELAKKGNDAAIAVRTVSVELGNGIHEVIRQQSELLQKSKNQTEWVLFVSTGISIVMGMCIAFVISRRIANDIGRLVTRAQRIAEGDVGGGSEQATSSDEMGDLARSFSAMVSYLQDMAAVSEAIAGGDLTVEVVPRSSHDALGHAFARMTTNLGELVRGVRDSASQVASGAGQVASASEESARVGQQSSSAIDEVTSTMHEMSINVQNMVKNTQMQAASVSETSTSIDQMVTSIQRVANTSDSLIEISRRSQQEVQNGIASMDKATNGLNRINSSIQSSAQSIDELGHRVNDIGKVIEVIDDLAEQTNLLALNAAIEAARAGEHGLGFAVVAEEVRKLAEKSAESTKEVSELIRSIQTEARKAIGDMNQSTSIVNEGLALGGDLSAALKKIANVVTEVYKFAQEIGAATREQSNGSSQIAQATNRLNQITQEISSSAEEQTSGAQAVVKATDRMRELVQQSASSSAELAASAEQISKMSRSLLEMMDRFKLGSDGMQHLQRSFVAP